MTRPTMVELEELAVELRAEGKAPKHVAIHSHDYRREGWTEHLTLHFADGVSVRMTRTTAVLP